MLRQRLLCAFVRTLVLALAASCAYSYQPPEAKACPMFGCVTVCDTSTWPWTCEGPYCEVTVGKGWSCFQGEGWCDSSLEPCID